MEFWDLTDKEFKVYIMKKLSEIQEDLERQFNEVRNKISEQKEYFANQIETLKMNQTENEPNSSSSSGAEEPNK